MFCQKYIATIKSQEGWPLTFWLINRYVASFPRLYFEYDVRSLETGTMFHLWVIVTLTINEPVSLCRYSFWGTIRIPLSCTSKQTELRINYNMSYKKGYVYRWEITRGQQQAYNGNDVRLTWNRLKKLLYLTSELIETVILWVYYTIPYGFSLIRHFWGIVFHLLNLLCLAKDHLRGFSTRNAHIFHIVYLIRFKTLYISEWKSLFILRRFMQNLLPQKISLPSSPIGDLHCCSHPTWSPSFTCILLCSKCF